jgi:hypothetical protein
MGPFILAVLVLAVIAIAVWYLWRESSKKRQSSPTNRAPNSARVRTGSTPNVYRPSLSARVPDSTTPGTDQSANIHSPSAASHPQTQAPGLKLNPNIYRPSTSSRPHLQEKVEFRCGGDNGTLAVDQDIKDLVDALTGAPLQSELGLYQCKRCKVFYQAQSYQVIQSENGGRCVSCLNTGIERVAARQERRGRNAEVGVITLDDYRQYVGRVITFEGEVRRVLPSRRGTDYAVMFEDRSWSNGFKMVVFQGDLSRIGGPVFVAGLAGRRVRVRGLMARHETYGYEIIVSDPAMILSVQ